MAAAVVEIKTGKKVDQGKTHMTVTLQTVFALLLIGMVVGAIFAATRKTEKKGYLMYAGIFGAFGALAAVATQVIDVKGIKSKEVAPLPANDTAETKTKVA